MHGEDLTERKRSRNSTHRLERISANLKVSDKVSVDDKIPALESEKISNISRPMRLEAAMIAGAHGFHATKFALGLLVASVVREAITEVPYGKHHFIYNYFPYIFATIFHFYFGSMELFK